MKPFFRFATFSTLILVVMSIITGEDFQITFWYLILLFINVICLIYIEEE